MGECQMIRSRNYSNLAADSSREGLDQLEMNYSSSSGYDNQGDIFNEATQAEDIDREAESIEYIDGEPSATDQNPDQVHTKVTNNEDQISLLRELLRTERQMNERRSKNSIVMSNYIKNLQSEYLGLQRDLIETLELSKKLRAQKEAQIMSQQATMDEKDSLIKQLRRQLEETDESNLRQEFENRLVRQRKLATLELDQLKSQSETIEHELRLERATNTRIHQEYQLKLSEQAKSHDKYADSLKAKIEHLDAELNRILNEPKNQAIRALKLEKNELERKFEEASIFLEDSRSKYGMACNRIEGLIADHNRLEQNSRQEIECLKEQYIQLRHHCNQLRLELEDKDETIQVAQFNVQRSERRVRNLIGALKGKEATYKDLIGQITLRHEQEVEQYEEKIKNFERKLIDRHSELDQKQNELVRLQMEQENQLGSLRNDRDQRISRLTMEKQKAERELQMAEIKLDKERRELEARSQVIVKVQAECKQFREESKRLSIELTKSEAKLFSKTRELDEAKQVLDTNTNTFTSDLEPAKEDVESERKRVAMLEKTLEMLRDENQRLTTRLKISETSISKMKGAIKNELAKLVADYEARMELIKEERNVCEKNRQRYKKQGGKLKKYLEHLRLAHGHECNPITCHLSRQAEERSNFDSKLV